MKKLVLAVSVCLICTPIIYGATEFVCTVMESGGDYPGLSAWNSAIACDLAHSTATRVFAHGGITGTVSDGAIVTGATSGATGVACHVTATQVLIKLFI